MKVNFELKPRLGRVEEVAALLFFTTDLREVLQACSLLSIAPMGRVFVVDRGILLKIEGASSQVAAIPGTLRLRALAKNLFLPLQSNLTPALLPDEQEILSQKRGLVFLPGRTLRFDPFCPLAADQFLTLPQVHRSGWTSLPEPKRLATQIREILIELPGMNPDGGGDSTDSEQFDETIFGPQASEIGSDPIDITDQTKPTASAKNPRGAGGIAGFFHSLAKAMGFAKRAVSQTGLQRFKDVKARQEAALNELLNRFKSGDIDQALRNSPPIGNARETRGSEFYTGDQLPDNDLNFDLNSMTDSNFGTGRWAGGEGLFGALQAEYHNAAKIAMNRGDFRRAATIYGKLLNDYRTAALVLQKGGYHRDAATIFLKKLNDTRSAARALEAAGDFDQAIRFYKQNSEHMQAGELLDKIGESEAALEQFELAADAMIRGEDGYLAAGDYLHRRTKRVDLASKRYEQGWSYRGSSSAIQCALRLARFHAEAQNPKELLTLLDEASNVILSRDSDFETRKFFQDYVEISLVVESASCRDDIKDRALLAITERLRKRVESQEKSGAIISSILGNTRLLTASQIRDADFAVSSAIRRQENRSHPTAQRMPTQFKIGHGLVTAHTVACSSGDIFIGFDNGDVFRFVPETSEVSLMASYDLPVTSIATDESGNFLVVLRANRVGDGVISSYEKTSNGFYRIVLGSPLSGIFDPWLTPIVCIDSTRSLVGLGSSAELELLEVGSLISIGHIHYSKEPTGATSEGVLIPAQDLNKVAYLVFSDKGAFLYTGLNPSPLRISRNWAHNLPYTPGQNRVVSICTRSNFSTVAVIFVNGPGQGITWFEFEFQKSMLALKGWSTIPSTHDYQVGVCLSKRSIALANDTQVDWYDIDGSSHHKHVGSTSHNLSDVVACFSSRKMHEVILLNSTGSIVRVSHSI
jgi:tetratricopeptide (TPR) repeat protein